VAALHAVATTSSPKRYSFCRGANTTNRNVCIYDLKAQKLIGMIRYIVMAQKLIGMIR